MKRKKLAVLSDHPIYPPRRGGEIRVFNILKGLSDYLDIELLSSSKFFWRRTFTSPTDGTFDEIHVPQNPLQVASWLLMSRFDRDPVSDIGYGYTWRLDLRLRRLVKSELAGADIVMLERPCLFPLLGDLRGVAPLVIYDAHDVCIDLKEEILLSSVLRNTFLSKTMKMERRACSRSDLIFTTCQEDKDRMAAAYGVPGEKIFVVPHGVDTRRISCVSRPERDQAKKELGLEGPLVLFVGSAHPPTPKPSDT